MLENFSRNCGAVVALAADVHRAYQKKSVLRMYVGVYTCFALLIGGGEKNQQPNITVVFLFKV